MLGLRRIYKFSEVSLVLIAAYLPATAGAQPAVLASEMESGFYQTYLLEDKGIFRQSQILAINDQPAGGATFAFIEGDYNYDTNWRPYASGLILSSYNTTIVPLGGTASAVYNSGFGGADGRLPFITSGNYYTTNITEYSVPSSLQNEYMAVLETTYQPVDILSLTQDPASGVTEASNVLVSVTLSAPLSAGEYLYLRYSSTYNFTSSTLLELNEGVGYHFEYIPCSTDSVYYYVFTSNQDSSYIMNQVDLYGNVAYDMMTLDLINNGGPNYIYLPLPSAEPCYYTLPVELLRFDLFAENNLVYLDWETASEINSDFFEVQRSADGHEWEYLGKVDAKGQTSVTTNYSFTDDNPLNGRSYYQLRMVDEDGSYDFSPVRSLWQSSTAFVNITPNPANDQAQIAVYSEGHSAMQILITDMRGTAIYQSEETIDNGFQTIALDVSSWVEGLYILEYRLQNGLSGQQKLVVIH